MQASWRLGTGDILTLASNFAPAPVPLASQPASLLFGVAPEGNMLPGMTTLAFLETAR